MPVQVCDGLPDVGFSRPAGFEAKDRSDITVLFLIFKWSLMLQIIIAKGGEKR
jgi:hypothetical protein